VDAINVRKKRKALRHAGVVRPCTAWRRRRQQSFGSFSPGAVWRSRD